MISSRIPTDSNLIWMRKLSLLKYNKATIISLSASAPPDINSRREKWPAERAKSRRRSGRTRERCTTRTRSRGGGRVDVEFLKRPPRRAEFASKGRCMQKLPSASRMHAHTLFLRVPFVPAQNSRPKIFVFSGVHCMQKSTGDLLICLPNAL